MSAGAVRQRLGRGELNRERVLAAGLALLEREGESALSMRRLAAELRTAPMSLYRHVRDKADLVDGVVGLALAEISISPPEGDDWAERCQAWMSALREQLNRHPAIHPLLKWNHLMLPAVLAPVELLLEELRGAGFDPKQAAMAAWEMLWFTASFVHSEQRSLTTAEPPLPAPDTLLGKALPELLALEPGDIFASATRHLTKGLSKDPGRT